MPCQYGSTESGSTKDKEEGLVVVEPEAGNTGKFQDWVQVSRESEGMANSSLTILQ